MNNGKEKSETDDIGCLEAINNLYAYLDNELDDALITKIEHHVKHCRSCFSRTELEGTLTERIKKSAKVDSSEKLQKRLQNLIDSF